MRTLLISDTHFKHENMKTHCDRPANFTERLIKNWHQRVSPEDVIIHLGDVAIGRLEGWKWIVPSLPGRKILIRGNHDRNRSPYWWMANGFDFACDSMIYRGCWLTHEPAIAMPAGCVLNLHGHLHNVWHGFAAEALVGPNAEYLRTHLKEPWQRLFAVEYTDYCPIEFDEFVAHPDKYQARGPR